MTDSQTPPEASPPPEPTPETISQLLTLYNAARNEHAKAGRNASSTSPAHVAAVTFAREHSLPRAADLLEAVVLSLTGHPEEAWKLVDDVLSDLPPALHGQAHHVRGFVQSNRKKFSEAITEYEAALSSPGYDSPGDALNNLGLAYANKKDYDRAIEFYHQALDTPEYANPEDALHNLGLAYANKKDYDRAIEYYQKALDTPGYDDPGMTLDNLGNVYANKKDYDRAIEYYQKALDTPGYDNPGKTLINLGNAYADKKEYDRAIESYKKALDTPEYDSPGDALNNLGIAYANKQDYDRAIESYQKALDTPGYDTLHLTRLNLVNSLRLSDRLDEALELVEKVVREPDKEGQHDRAKFIKRLILSDKARIPSSPGDEALAKSSPASLDPDSPESRMKDKLFEREDKYDDYQKAPESKRQNTFSVLRGWSSAVTLLEGTKDGHWRGGGYFLKWQGKGIAIDPGFDFLDNFHDAGFHAREIQAALVSHNHSDHNNDLRALDDLCYEIYKRPRTSDDGTALPPPDKIQLVLDEDTASIFEDDRQDHRDSPLAFYKAHYQRKRWIESDETGLPVTIEHFPVQHGMSVPHAVGIRLRLHGDSPFTIGYTGDTKYFEKSKNESGLAEHLQGSDLLLAHISQPANEELVDETHFKKTHLGYNGVTKLINDLIELKSEPKIILIGEFWAGLADLRIELIQGLRNRTGRNNIFPVGLRFHISIPSLDIECTECHKPTPFSKIHISPPTTPFGPLGYLCGNCII